MPKHRKQRQGDAQHAAHTKAITTSLQHLRKDPHVSVQGASYQPAEHSPQRANVSPSDGPAPSALRDHGHLKAQPNVCPVLQPSPLRRHTKAPPTLCRELHPTPLRRQSHHNGKSQQRRPAKSAPPSPNWLLVNGYQPKPGMLSNLNTRQDGRKVPHQVFQNGKWSNSRLEDHGRVQLQLEICHGVAKSQGFQEPRSTRPTSVLGLADTGAQMCVASMQVAKNLGLQRVDLLKPQLKISVADNSGLNVIGAAFVFITTNAGATSRQLVYFADTISDFFLSKSALRDLNLIPSNFPGPVREPPTAPHPPTNPSGLGNQGGSLSSTGVYSVSSVSPSNFNHPHVQPRQPHATSSSPTRGPSGTVLQPPHAPGVVPLHHPLSTVPSATTGPIGQFLQPPPGLPAVLQPLHPPTNPLGLGNQGGPQFYSGVYSNPLQPPPNHHLPHVQHPHHGPATSGAPSGLIGRQDAPCVPQGMVSLGPRSPTAEGETSQTSLAAKPNGSRVHTVRVEPPPAVHQPPQGPGQQQRDLTPQVRLEVNAAGADSNMMIKLQPQAGAPSGLGEVYCVGRPQGLQGPQVLHQGQLHQLYPLTDAVRNLGGTDSCPGKPVDTKFHPPNPPFPVVTLSNIGPEPDLEWTSGQVSSVIQEELQQGQLFNVKKDAKGRILAPCGCLKRTLPPQPPSQPPFPLTPANTDQVTAWLLDFYASSAFNTCTHQPLPLMSGLPPLRLLIKEGAEPTAIHKPATVPAHWLDQVKQELEQDIALGVLERVPSNTPTTWCSRMHVVGKKSGDPRRVVDLRQVNASTQRQTHYTEPPFSQAMGIAPNTW